MKRYFIGFIPFSILLLSFQIISGQPINPSFSKNIVKETNQFRRSKGLPALISRNDLNVIAQKHSTNMARGKVAFGHDGFTDRSQKAKRVLSGKLKGFAENVAYGAKNANEVVRGWANSPGHRRNMLGTYKYIGIGIAADKKGRLYYTQIFVN